MKDVRLYFLALVLSTLLIACSDDDVPEVENDEEFINLVTLTFTPNNTNADVVVVTAEDPDGQGPRDIAVSSEIVLKAHTTYTLRIDLKNTVSGESIAEEVQEEADEHAFFFGWSAGLFADPSGTGNISGDGVVNYQDFDENQLPLGLSTSWTTGDATSGDFQIILKHQPGMKSEVSTVEEGSTDLELEWSVIVE